MPQTSTDEDLRYQIFRYRVDSNTYAWTRGSSNYLERMVTVDYWSSMLYYPTIIVYGYHPTGFWVADMEYSSSFIVIDDCEEW